MRGIPKNPVECRICHEIKARPKNGLCPRCDIRQKSRPSAFSWTPAFDVQLRDIYAGARRKSKLSRALDVFQRRCGFPRGVINARAQRLGITAPRWHFWRREELDLLREHAGSWSVAKIALKLGRSTVSVKMKAASLGISMQLADSYSREEIAEVLGVDGHRVSQWIECGWLRASHVQGQRNTRINHGPLVKFIRMHPEEYDLRRVDQAWFKGALFPAYGLKRTLEELGERRPSERASEDFDEFEVRA